MPPFTNQETNDTNIKGIVMPSIANQDNISKPTLAHMLLQEEGQFITYK